MPAWLQPAWAERRIARRREARLPGETKHPDFGRRQVALLDLSASGCRLECAFFRPGDKLWLAITNLSPRLATVAWSSNKEIGLRFDRSLHPAVVDHLVAQSV